MNWEEKNFYQQTYSVSMDDLMQVWIETFHPFSVLLIIWDAKNHFDLLNRCGIAINLIESFTYESYDSNNSDIFDWYEDVDIGSDDNYNIYKDRYTSWHEDGGSISLSN